MRYLSIILLFFYTTCSADQCLYHNQLHDHDNVAHRLDCQSRRTYPCAPSTNNIRMMLVPGSCDQHAQYLTAAAYRMVQDDDFDTVIVICQSDSVAFHGVAMPCAGDAHSIDFLRAVDRVQKRSPQRLFFWYDLPFSEHDVLRLHSRLLQFYCKDSIVVPLIIGQISHNDALEIVATIIQSCTQHTLIVVSANLAMHTDCHHLCPTDQSKLCAVYDRDSLPVQALASRTHVCQVARDIDCSLAMFFLYEHLLQLPNFNKLRPLLVGYATFEDTLHDRVTSYAAFVFHECGMVQSAPVIGWYEQQQLLYIARTSLHDLFDLPYLRKPCMMSYAMTYPGGVFASLYAMTDHGVALRGCMGKVRSILPLSDMVYQMTQQAACKDTRFYPLQQRDVYNSIISLSVVTDLYQIDQHDDISQFDGVVLEYGNLSAVCMPCLQQPLHWNRQSMLADLSLQISSCGFVWKKPKSAIFTFRSMVFQED